MSTESVGSEALLNVLRRQRESLARAGAPTLVERRQRLATLQELVLDNKDALADAIHRDFGNRCRSETLLLEVQAVAAHARYMARHLKAWMRNEPRPIAWNFQPAAARVEHVPAGVVGIISPWNYPLVLALFPLATALAAGNRVMLKPSEKSPRTSTLVAELLHRAFPQDQVYAAMGGIEVGAAFARLPFDHLIFTGSTAVGRTIMHAAARNLVPVTLELGGKSPALIDHSVDVPRVARRVAYGKLVNAGQTCMAPDYALVPRALTTNFVEEFVRAAGELYPGIATNKDYTSIATDEHHRRLSALIADAQARGAQVIRLGDRQDGRTHRRTMNPVVLLDVNDSMKVMQEEIFGPVLPIVSYDRLDDAIDIINARPHSLTLYLFGHRREFLRTAIDRTSSGNVACNETIIHYAQEALPFGGVGDSGMGAYHGYEGFKRLSHARSVFVQSRFNLVDWVYPPYGGRLDRLLKLMLRR